MIASSRISAMPPPLSPPVKSMAPALALESRMNTDEYEISPAREVTVCKNIITKITRGPRPSGTTAQQESLL